MACYRDSFTFFTLYIYIYIYIYIYVYIVQQREGKAINQGCPACSVKGKTKVFLVVTL
jgi:hypothetical protein